MTIQAMVLTLCPPVFATTVYTNDFQAPGVELIDTTSSNNFKTGVYDVSLQDYPRLNSAPPTGAVAVNRLGYTFFGDSTYHFAFTVPHAADSLILEFASSMFEAKGTADESWELDNVTVGIDHQTAPIAGAVVNAAGLGSVVSSGAWIAIFGENPASSTRAWSNADVAENRLPTELDGTRVEIGGKAAYVSLSAPLK